MNDMMLFLLILMIGSFLVIIALTLWRLLKKKPIVEREKRSGYVLAFPIMNVQPGEESMVSVEPLRGIFLPRKLLLRGPGLFVTKIIINGKHQMVHLTGTGVPIEAFSPEAPEIMFDVSRFGHPIQMWLRNSLDVPIPFSGMVRGEIIETVKGEEKEQESYRVQGLLRKMYLDNLKDDDRD